MLIVAGYPLALLFGLPLARRDMNDLRKWEKETVQVAQGQTLIGIADGQNQSFGFGVKLVENDKERTLFVGDTALSYDAERPNERVNGETAVFSFESDSGLIVLNDVLQSEGADYRRDGASIDFRATPPRNAKLRQYKDYYISDPETGTAFLALAPEAGLRIWTDRYTIYSQPSCGTGLLECFYALPQHPVPYPHWIAGRIVPFFGKFPLHDERNVIRATLYTTLGTLSALLLGGAVGIFLAILFVLFRPLEGARGIRLHKI